MSKFVANFVIIFVGIHGRVVEPIDATKVATAFDSATGPICQNA